MDDRRLRIDSTVRRMRTRPSRSATKTRPSGATASDVGAQARPQGRPAAARRRRRCRGVCGAAAGGNGRAGRRASHGHAERRRLGTLDERAVVVDKRHELNRVGAGRHRRHAAAAREVGAARAAARHVGELDAIAIDVGGIAERRELSPRPPRPDSSRAVRCRRCARRSAGGSDVDGGVRATAATRCGRATATATSDGSAIQPGSFMTIP